MWGSRASVEQSINDFQAPLSLARSRLSVRANKPGIEVRPNLKGGGGGGGEPGSDAG